MKSFIKAILFLLIGFLIGWAFGYLRLPFLNEKHLFWVGVLCAIVLGILFSFLFKSKSRKRLFINSFGLIAFTLIVSFITNYFLVQYKLIADKNTKQNQEFLNKKENILFEGLKLEQIKAVNEFVKSFKLNNLDSTSLTRLGLLNETLNPFESLDTAISKVMKTSPGRGYLLKQILILDLEESELDKIYNHISFQFTDLKGVNLEGAYLTKINLSYSDLRNSTLSNAQLAYANLEGSNLDKAFLKNINAKNALFDKVSMNWTNFQNAQLDSTYLNGVLANNTNFSYTNLNGAKINWSKLKGANFRFSNLKNVDFFSSDLSYSNLESAEIKNARLIDVNLEQAILKNTIIDSTSVNKDWFKRLDDWNLINKKSINQTHKLLIKDSLRKYSNEKYFLIRN